MFRKRHIAVLSLLVLFSLFRAVSTGAILLWYGPAIIPIDIKPNSCPNPLNVESEGVLPVAILGTETLGVAQIDITSLNILGVKPIRSSYEDVAAPVAEDILPEECACTTDGPDGHMDLTLEFDKQEIIETLGYTQDGDYFLLTLSGLMNAMPIEGTDCVLIIKTDTNTVVSEANMIPAVDMFPNSTYDNTSQIPGCYGTVKIALSEDRYVVFDIYSEGLTPNSLYKVFFDKDGIEPGKVSTSGPWKEIDTFVSDDNGSGQWNYAVPIEDYHTGMHIRSMFINRTDINRPVLISNNIEFEIQGTGSML